MAGDTNLSSRNERTEKQPSPIAEERPEVQLLLVRQDRESRQGIALVSTDGWRQPPHAASSVAQLGQFLFGEFDQAIRRVSADRMNGLRWTTAQPVKAIGVFDAVQASFEYQEERGLSFNYS